jgi:hypothetical protein
MDAEETFNKIQSHLMIKKTKETRNTFQYNKGYI